MKRMHLAMLVASVFLGLTACGTESSNEAVGTLGGAVVGGVAGHVIGGGSALGTIGGAATGALVGHEIGEHADAENGSCSYHGNTYSDGSLSCQRGYEYSCRDGRWVSGERGC